MPQITLDLNIPLLDLDGNPELRYGKTGEVIKNDAGENKHETLCRVLGSAMAHSNDGNDLKMGDWAMDLWKGRTIMLDMADKNDILQWLSRTKSLTHVMKKQIREKINDVVKAIEKKEEIKKN